MKSTLLVHHSLSCRIIRVVIAAFVLSSTLWLGYMNPEPCIAASPIPKYWAKNWDSIPYVKRSKTISNNRLGEIGENNVDVLFSKSSATKKWMQSDFIAYPQSLKRSVNHHGLDALYKSLNGKQYNIIEAKATRQQGRIGTGILSNHVDDAADAADNSIYKQMDDKWINKKLDEHAKNCTDALDALPDAKVLTPEEHLIRQQANQTLDLITRIRNRGLANQQKTLVITRYHGIDRSQVTNNRTITANLASKFDHVWEVDPGGRLLISHH